MPLILAGFTWLATFFGTLLVEGTAWIGLYAAKRIAVIATAIAALVTAAGVFYAAIGAIASGLMSASPLWLSQACSMVVPDSAQACFTAILSAQTARIIYVWQFRVINMKAD